MQRYQSHHRTFYCCVLLKSVETGNEWSAVFCIGSRNRLRLIPLPHKLPKREFPNDRKRVHNRIWCDQFQRKNLVGNLSNANGVLATPKYIKPIPIPEANSIANQEIKGYSVGRHHSPILYRQACYLK